MKTTITEKTTNSLSGIIIRILVFTSVAIVITGGVLYLLKYGLSMPEYSTFHKVESTFTNPIIVFYAALNFDPKAIIQLGILILIAIPLIRVILFLILFLFQRDWLYSCITFFVLSILIFSFVSGMH
jgi:uncharacterized membrane protein